MWNVDFGAINWLAVLVSAVVSFIIGGAWYAAIFAKAWQRLHGFTDEQARALGANPARTFGILGVCDLVAPLVLAVLAQKTGVETLTDGVGLGFWCWLLAMAAFVVSTYAASGLKLGLVLIDGGKLAVCLMVTGAILGAWR